MQPLASHTFLPCQRGRMCGMWWWWLTVKLMLCLGVQVAEELKHLEGVNCMEGMLSCACSPAKQMQCDSAGSAEGTARAQGAVGRAHRGDGGGGGRRRAPEHLERHLQGLPGAPLNPNPISVAECLLRCASCFLARWRLRLVWSKADKP